MAGWEAKKVLSVHQRYWCGIDRHPAARLTMLRSVHEKWYMKGLSESIREFLYILG